MILTNKELSLCQSLMRGWEKSLLEIMLRRCDCTMDNWNSLQSQDYVHEVDGSYTLTKLGKREFKRQKKGRYY